MLSFTNDISFSWDSIVYIYIYICMYVYIYHEYIIIYMTEMWRQVTLFIKEGKRKWHNILKFPKFSFNPHNVSKNTSEVSTHHI